MKRLNSTHEISSNISLWASHHGKLTELIKWIFEDLSLIKRKKKKIYLQSFTFHYFILGQFPIPLKQFWRFYLFVFLSFLDIPTLFSYATCMHYNRLCLYEHSLPYYLFIYKLTFLASNQLSRAYLVTLTRVTSFVLSFSKQKINKIKGEINGMKYKDIWEYTNHSFY